MPARGELGLHTQVRELIALNWVCLVGYSHSLTERPAGTRESKLLPNQRPQIGGVQPGYNLIRAYAALYAPVYELEKDILSSVWTYSRTPS